MKRLFFILFSILISVVVSAGVTIPQNINGVRLGKSTHKDVDRILTANGMQFDAEESDTTNFVYRGECRHENMDFGGVVTRYYMDTLIMLSFVGRCDSSCVDYGKPFIHQIHTKYGELQSADSSIYYSKITSGVDPLGLKKWGRTDGNTLVVTLSNDSVCSCMYFAEGRMMEIMANALFRLYMEFDPNYADENKVYGVAGVKFGDSRETVRKTISSKANQLLESDAHSLNYYKVKIGGMTYDYATFYFSGEKGLVSVNMQSSFYSWREEEALLAFENVKSQYSRKYTNFKVVKDERDEKVCTCGAFIEGYDYIPIIITFQKSLSRGGDIMYYVQVDYYHARRNGMYDDEI